MSVPVQAAIPLFTLAEAEEIQMYAAHYAAKKGSGSVAIQLNFHKGKLPVVVVNGRRFEREKPVD